MMAQPSYHVRWSMTDFTFRKMTDCIIIIYGSYRYSCLVFMWLSFLVHAAERRLYQLYVSSVQYCNWNPGSHGRTVKLSSSWCLYKFLFELFDVRIRIIGYPGLQLSAWDVNGTNLTLSYCYCTVSPLCHDLIKGKERSKLHGTIDVLYTPHPHRSPSKSTKPNFKLLYCNPKSRLGVRLK